MIDTPGHEAFHNLRERGSSLCDFAILVVDIEYGLMPQTKDSIKLLKDRNIPFIIAATKIDKIYGWEKNSLNSFKASYRKQSDEVRGAFYNYIEGLKESLLEFEIKADLHYSFKNIRKNNLDLVEKEESKLKTFINCTSLFFIRRRYCRYIWSIILHNGKMDEEKSKI